MAISTGRRRGGNNKEWLVHVTFVDGEGGTIRTKPEVWKAAAAGEGSGSRAASSKPLP